MPGPGSEKTKNFAAEYLCRVETVGIESFSLESLQVDGLNQTPCSLALLITGRP